jgi:dihydropteroate synthase
MQTILQNNCNKDKVRVHDVSPISQTLRMAAALW